MAPGTCHGYVRILQREIRQVVREARLVELIDVGVAAQVLGMAAAALAGGCLRHPAVITGLGADISGDFLVTVETQGGLARAVGTVVAVTAFAFDLGVGLGYRPGHDELFDVRGVHSRCEQRGEQHKQQRLRREPRSEHAVALLGSVHVHGNHMHDAGGNQHEK